MRFLTLLALAGLLCTVGADWFRWSGGSDNTPSWTPQETGLIVESAQIGLAPQPTPAAGVATLGHEQVLGLLRRGESITPWANPKTCGWFPSVSSEPFTCGENATCETNDNHIVACVTGTVSPFYSACLNYAAYQSGSCVDDNQGTGCCMNSDYGDCATHMWTDPQRSMYRCFSTSTIFSMLDVPQFVADASLPTTAQTQSLLTATKEPDSTNTSSEKPATTPTVNAGKVVGTTIGSLVGFLLICCCILCIHFYRKEVKQDHAKIHARINRAFQYSANSQQWTMATLAPVPAAPSQAAVRYTPVEPQTPPQQTRRMSAYDSMGHLQSTSTLRTRSASTSDVRSEDETPPPAYSLLNPYPATTATPAAPTTRSATGTGMRRYGFGAVHDVSQRDRK
ncbi:hypothetical protein GGS26DRAFT_585851 [Hypomontagnella submonticulosa]|nr:hypothetical protein GGS26DRAFT_585851 [Hypomontagnella submonticulosa]